MRRLAKQKEFQIGQEKTKGRVCLERASNLQSKKVDLQKAYEIIVSGNVGHLEAYDSIIFVHME